MPSKTLILLLGDEQREVALTDNMINEAQPIFDKMDADMSQGWQLSRDYIGNPNLQQRCQIAANRLMTALHTGNTALVSLMAAYIVSRLPNTRTVNINTDGEDDQTSFYDIDDRLIS
jgi:hypothetical protein